MMSSLTVSNSCTAPTSGTMISTRGTPPALMPLGRRLEDRPGLHLEQAGDDHAEPDAAQPEHRVLLVQPVHRLQHPQVALARLAARLGDRHPHRQLGDVGQELVQRRVEQPDGHRQAVHRLEDAR